MLTIVGPHAHGTVTPQRLSTEMSSAAAAVAGRALYGRRGNGVAKNGGSGAQS